MEGTLKSDPDQDPGQLRVKMNSAPKRAQIAPHGDVLLLFGEGLVGGTRVCGPCLRVSAAHLALKSIVFRRMLDGPGFAETRRLRDAGCLEMELPDDDYTAFTIIMQVVHGHFDNVPKRVNLELFTEIATLVDKYEWHEVMRIHANGWIAAHRTLVPTAPDKLVVPWLWIFWVFNRTLEFRALTEMLERDSTAASFEEAPECPLPDCVIAKINRKRQDALLKVKERFDQLCSQYLFLSEVNRPAGAFCYGMCQIQGQVIGLANSRDLAKKSFRTVANAIYSMEDTVDYRIFKETGFGSRSPGITPPAIKRALVATVKDSEANIQGIRLESLKKMRNTAG